MTEYKTGKLYPKEDIERDFQYAFMRQGSHTLYSRVPDDGMIYYFDHLALNSRYWLVKIEERKR